MIDFDPRQPRVTLVATHTVDRVPQADGSVEECPGGPAHYTAEALDSLHCPYRLITGAPACANVVFGPAGEDYLIPALPLIPLPRKFETEAVILSPIMQEIDPHAVPPADGMLAIDLQGFVRVPMTPFHAVKTRFSLADLLSRVTLVKGSRDEIDRLDDRSRKALSRTILLATQGGDGVVVCREGRETHVAATPLHDTLTIGAGDAFLAAMVVAFLEGLDPEEAAVRSTRFVERLLLTRRSLLGGADK